VKKHKIASSIFLTSANRVSRKLVPGEVLRRDLVFLIFLAALFIFEPIFVLLTVGHGGAFEGAGLMFQFLVGDLLLWPILSGLEGTMEVSITQISIAQIGITQICTA
jgi:hypothetical protein